jgi:hypothetical protein
MIEVCLHCGYSLHGLPAQDHPCPECGRLTDMRAEREHVSELWKHPVRLTQRLLHTFRILPAAFWYTDDAMDHDLRNHLIFIIMVIALPSFAAMFNAAMVLEVEDALIPDMAKVNASNMLPKPEPDERTSRRRHTFSYHGWNIHHHPRYYFFGRDEFTDRRILSRKVAWMELFRLSGRDALRDGLSVSLACLCAWLAASQLIGRLLRRRARDHEIPAAAVDGGCRTFGFVFAVVASAAAMTWGIEAVARTIAGSCGVENWWHGRLIRDVTINIIVPYVTLLLAARNLIRADRAGLVVGSSMVTRLAPIGIAGVYALVHVASLMTLDAILRRF